MDQEQQRPRRALVRAVRFFVERPARLAGLALAVVALVAAGGLALTALSPGGGSPNLASAGTGGAIRPTGEPQATEAFLRGTRDANASLVWGSLSTAAQAQMQARSITPEQRQQELEQQRAAGFSLEDVSYVGGRALPDGTSLHFYLVALRPSRGTPVRYVPYTFTVDSDGKIVKVQ